MEILRKVLNTYSNSSLISFLFTLLIFSFVVQKLLILIRSHLKNCPVDAERGFRCSPDSRGLLKDRWALVVLEGERFKDIFAQPNQGTSQPAEVGQVAIHLLDEFHLLP